VPKEKSRQRSVSTHATNQSTTGHQTPISRACSAHKAARPADERLPLPAVARADAGGTGTARRALASGASNEDVGRARHRGRARHLATLLRMSLGAPSHVPFPSNAPYAMTRHQQQRPPNCPAPCGSHHGHATTTSHRLPASGIPHLLSMEHVPCWRRGGVNDDRNVQAGGVCRRWADAVTEMMPRTTTTPPTPRDRRSGRRAFAGGDRARFVD